MIISTYDVAELQDAFGIDMSAVKGLGVGAAWARVAPGRHSEGHQHDESEIFVIVSGRAEIVVDGKRHRAGPGTVALFDPFERHVIENVADTDLVLLALYWRDAGRAVHAATRRDRRRLGERPLFVFSTPPTPNGDLHLGHLSGPYLGADAFVRFQRMNRAEAWHLTGSDDFQSYVCAAAQRDGLEPAQTAAHYSAEIADTLALMDIELDQYTVTSVDAGYTAGLQDFFSRLVASGSVAPQDGPALFDGETGEYLYEVDVRGACPGCGTTTGGNICEECGEPNVCVDLGDPRSSRSEAPPRRGEIARFSLPLHEFRDDVTAHHRLGRVPARLRELAERIFQRGALDLPISHPASWGVAPREPGGEGQVIWVWPEMAFGFLHGIESLGRSLGREWRADDPQEDWKIVHFFGYDNSFYHGVLYPVLYRLAFPGWEPDIDYNVNEFYLLEGSKFSTSRRHAIWGKDVLGPHSVDAVRYFLARTRPEGRRTNFEHSAYEAVLEGTLVGTWQRWLNDLGARVQSRGDGVVPDAGVWTPEHTAFLGSLATRLAALSGSLAADGFSLNRAAEELDGIVEDATRFAGLEHAVAQIDSWSDETRTATALELAAAQLLARCAAPVMPRFAARLATALGTAPPTEWPETVSLLEPGTRIDLAHEVFFRAAPATADGPDPGPGPDATPALLPWLEELVRSILVLPAEEPVNDKTLMQLGIGSLQTVTLQYRLLEDIGVDVAADDLLGDRDVIALAAQLERLAPSGAGIADAVCT